MRTVFVISDLHLGGRPHDTVQDGKSLPGFQFNNSYPELINFIDWLGRDAAPRAGHETELVINGDIVDFLADDDYGLGTPVPAWTPDERDATRMLELIAGRTRDADGRGVFEALKDFIAAGNRLTLLLGNHDPQLSLPMVRRRLRELLGGDSALLNFIYDGEAYTVGRLLVEHGNRYDRANQIDYNGLRQERSMRSRHLNLAEAERAQRYFNPPAGSHLVVNVMNPIKARYRFVDLLKPETGAVMTFLLALEPSAWPLINSIVDARMALPQYVQGGMQSPTLPADPAMMNFPTGGDPAHRLEQLLRDEIGARDAELFIEPRRTAHPDQDQANMGLRQSTAALGRVLAEWAGDTADGLARLASAGREAIPEFRNKQLHAALRKLHERDGSFDPEREDANYLDAARLTVATGAVDVVVYGHTHLPKRIRLDQHGRSCWYLNTGTWCDVLRLPQELTQDYEAARPTLMQLIAEIGHNHLQDRVTRYLSYVEIEVDPDGAPLAASPALRSWCGRGHERGAALTPYPHRAQVPPGQQAAHT